MAEDNQVVSGSSDRNVESLWAHRETELLCSADRENDHIAFCALECIDRGYLDARQSPVGVEVSLYL